MKPKAIVIDLDGTLLNSSKRISKRNLEALEAARAKGIYIIFATARPPRVTRFEEIDLSLLESIIYYNGALFHCKANKQDIHFSIPQALAKEIIEYCLKVDPKSNISIEVQDKWFSSKPLDYKEMMKVRNNPNLITQEELISYDCTKILLTEFSFSEQLIYKFGAELNILVTDSGNLIQIMSRESSKENAVDHILHSLNLKLTDAICFGDDYNDVGLFQSCGYSVAMGNAIDELKEIATETTETNDDDGVALVLERFFGDPDK